MSLPEPVPEPERALRPGDILRIEVWRQPEYSGEFQISTDGTLIHPLYQDVRMAGLPVSQAREEIATLLSRYLQGAPFVLQPLYSVAVGGEVRQPDMYHVDRGTTVAEAIGTAGGPTARAQLDRVLLVRDGIEYEMSLGEDLSTFGSIPIHSGDQILVYPQSDFSVWRDVVAPVGTLASLTLALIRIGDAR